MSAENNVHRLQSYFFFFLIGGVIILTFFIFKPYIAILFLGLVFSIIFEPIHRRINLLCGNHEGVAAFVSVMLVLVLILAPCIFFGTLLFQEATDLYVRLGQNGIPEIFNNVLRQFESLIEKVNPRVAFDITEHVDIRRYAEQGLLWVLDNFGSFFSGVLRGIVGFLFLIIAIFYFFKDGRRFTDYLISVSPLPDTHDKAIIGKLRLAVRSVINGYLLIAVVQGILTGIGFALFSLPSAVLWAFITMIVSFLPLFGISLVFIPAILFLFFSGNLLASVGLFLWAVFIVGLVDNILGPIFIERGMKIHPFLILISIVGGLEVMGPVGFIAGPVVLSLFFALLEIHSSMLKKSV
ncbi:MAG: AI-2E family transporter [Patescibacteria group bacterium]|nr:AI-2E family transporter [bacterium]MDZ4240613.1 AI-2E family transporter [Patescibacteria group bacterium]